MDTDSVPREAALPLAPHSGYDAHQSLVAVALMGLLVALVMGFVFLFFGCCGFLLSVVVGLLVGSVLLRAAVALANRTLGPVIPPDTFGQWDDWDSGEPGPTARKGTGRALPEPSLALGMVVTLALGVAAVLGYVALGILAEEVLDAGGPDGWVALVLIFVTGLPCSATGLAFLVMLLLPTTFRRAALVAFLYHFLAVVVLAAVAAVVVFVWALFVG